MTRLILAALLSLAGVLAGVMHAAPHRDETLI